MPQTSPVFVDANCLSCGPITLMIWDLRCGVDRKQIDRGLAEYSCPACERLHFTEVSVKEVVSLRMAGAREFTEVRPFELLEHHDDPPIDEDELIDMMLALQDEDAFKALS